MALPIVTLDGRVVGEPAFKYLENGTALLRVRVVCSDRRKGDDGKWFDAESLWMTVSVFGKLAENAYESLRDRDAVIVVGKLSTVEWEDGGVKRTANKVVASSIGPGVGFVPRPHHDSQQAPRQAEMTTVGRGQPPARQQAEQDDPWAY